MKATGKNRTLMKRHEPGPKDAGIKLGKLEARDKHRTLLERTMR